MSRINRPPIGLQGLLGSQSLGDNPSELAEGVVPTLDLFPFWAAQIKSRSLISGGRGTPGTIVENNPFPGEIWWVSQIALSATVIEAGGPHTFQGAIGLSNVAGDTPGHTTHLAVSEWRNTVATGSRWVMTFQPTEPLLVQPYESLEGIALDTSLTVATTFFLSILYYKITI